MDVDVVCELKEEQVSSFIGLFDREFYISEPAPDDMLFTKVSTLLYRLRGLAPLRNGRVIQRMSIETITTQARPGANPAHHLRTPRSMRFDALLKARISLRPRFRFLLHESARENASAYAR